MNASNSILIDNQSQHIFIVRSGLVLIIFKPYRKEQSPALISVALGYFEVVSLTSDLYFTIPKESSALGTLRFVNLRPTSLLFYLMVKKTSKGEGSFYPSFLRVMRFRYE
jgi:hypothetical protein